MIAADGTFEVAATVFQVDGKSQLLSGLLELNTKSGRQDICPDKGTRTH